MKTVMKKIFSLMLVAVLLVSAVPFAASAAEETKSWDLTLTAGETYSVDEICQQHYSGSSTNYWVQNGGSRGETFVASADRTYTLYVVETVTESEEPAHTHSWAAATCTAPKTCACGATEGEALGHDWADATCTAPKTCKRCAVTEGEALGHSYGNGTVCSVCDYCKLCETVITATTGHPVSCPNSSEYKTTCPNCNTEYITVNGHPTCTVCKDCHATAECPYCAVCWKNGDQVKTHKTSVHCAECNTVNDHASTCSKYQYPETGSRDLKVWARIWIHETEHKTILLDTISDLSSNAKIYQVIAANADRLEAKFPSGYHGIHWVETVYRKTSENTYKVVDTALTVGDEDDVYVNLYSAEKLVVVNVHTKKSFSYDMSVRVEGFRVGDTVTYNDVLEAVKEYYNVSSMSIYTYDEMQKFIEGKDANKTQNFIVTDGDNRYEVYIQGSRKGSSSSGYTADSTNPKTGDMIMAPAIIMCASFGALATLFYLNKKRAY